MPEFGTTMFGVIIATAVLVLFAVLMLIVRCWRKVEQGKALVRTGYGGTKVDFQACLCFRCYTVWR